MYRAPLIVDHRLAPIARGKSLPAGGKKLPDAAESDARKSPAERPLTLPLGRHNPSASAKGVAMDARLAFDIAGLRPAAPAGSPDALVAGHLGLVRRVAWHVHARMSSAIDLEDLCQIGMVALIEAARQFEDRGQAAFATYATMRIRGAMIDQLRKGATVVRSAMRRRRAFSKARTELEGRLGRAATDTEMAAELGLSLDEWHSAEASTQSIHTESLDEVYSDHQPWFVDDQPSAHERLAGKSLQRAVAQAIGDLPEREAMVLQLYFVEELNLEQIGEVLGVGPARICQIKKAALAKVRSRLDGWSD